jgi:hypothetical protein
MSVSPAAFSCPGGSGLNNPQIPIVCVTEDTLKADPKEIRIHNHAIGDETRPVRIHWFTKNGAGDLKVTMIDPGCLTKLMCPNRGHCTAVSEVKTTTSKVCRYAITLDGKPVDPTVIVDQCCM